MPINDHDREWFRSTDLGEFTSVICSKDRRGMGYEILVDSTPLNDRDLMENGSMT